MVGPWSWKEKTWFNHGFKHHWEFPPPAGKTWAEIRADTGKSIKGRPPTAKYHPKLTHRRWRELEYDTLRLKYEYESPDDNFRTFYRRVARRGLLRAIGLGYPIGASLGQDTDWIYVEWDSNPQGNFHGYPILASEFPAKVKRAMMEKGLL